MIAVVLSLLALCIGPVVGPLLHRFRGVAAAFDGFVVVTVVGLVVLHVLPQSVALGGAGVLALAAVGVAVPALLHRLDARQQSAAVRGGRDVAAFVVVAGAAFAHAVLDGAALVDGHEHGGVDSDGGSVPLLAVAVLLHRLPYGLALWTVGKERLGLTRMLVVLGALVGGTITGAVLGGALMTSSTAAGFAWVQAFAAGAILHVLLDAPPVDVSGAPRWSLAGVVGGLGVLGALAQTHPFFATVGRELDFGATLWRLSTRVASPLTLALLVSALLARLPQRLRVEASVVGAASGVVAGVLRTMCQCTVVPLFEGLVRRRASVAAAVAFLVGAPEVSAVSVFVSAEVLGVAFTGARVVFAVVLAVVVGVVVDREGGNAGEAAAVVEVDGPRSFSRALLASFDHAVPWLLASIVVASFLEPLLARDALAGIPPVVEVPLYVVVGVPFYVCGTGAAPIAAVLAHKGASVGAVVALWLAAPAMNLATLSLIARLISKQAAAAFVVVVFVVACAGGGIVNAFAGDIEVNDFHDGGGDGASLVDIVCITFVGVLLLTSIARQGARGFLGQILHPLDDAKGGHVHGPHCGHAEHRSPGFLKRPPVATVKIDFRP